MTRREAVFHGRDLNSTHGTYLGDVRLFEVEIPLITVLSVGETELVFEPMPAKGGRVTALRSLRLHLAQRLQLKARG